MQKTSANLPQRFTNEKLGEHWQVTSDERSFELLEKHISSTTNFKRFFNISIDKAFAAIVANNKSNLNTENQKLKIIDLGCGIGWTTALLAKRQNIDKIYAVEPNTQRRNRIKSVLKHYQANTKNITIINGHFSNFGVDDKVDLIIMCASFHHCTEDLMDTLLDNLKNNLKPNGMILLANEHYVDKIWIARRIIRWLITPNKKQLYFGPGNWNAPYPIDNEHWRTKKQIKSIFEKDFNVYLTSLPGDLCNDKPYFFQKYGWHYYYAILTKRKA